MRTKRMLRSISMPSMAPGQELHADLNGLGRSVDVERELATVNPLGRKFRLDRRQELVGENINRNPIVGKAILHLDRDLGIPHAGRKGEIWTVVDETGRPGEVDWPDRQAIGKFRSQKRVSWPFQLAKWLTIDDTIVLTRSKGDKFVLQRAAGIQHLPHVRRARK